ncbi:hypothetical protein [Marinicrinis sediminis]|uniref:YtxH domain-containing protein n=1 Tax=Marinicrinis sediminis TaxID=1652465 RepID=A0ABW5RE63_9BACL
MRFNSFLMGGVVGAAAAVYFSRRNMGMGSMMKNMGMPNLAESMKNEITKERSTSTQTNSTSHSEHAQHEQSGGIDQVAEIAAQDAGVMSEVNKILDENDQSSIQTH